MAAPTVSDGDRQGKTPNVRVRSLTILAEMSMCRSGLVHVSEMCRFHALVCKKRWHPKSFSR